MVVIVDDEDRGNEGERHTSFTLSIETAEGIAERTIQTASGEFRMYCYCACCRHRCRSTAS